MPAQPLMIGLPPLRRERLAVVQLAVVMANVGWALARVADGD